MFIDIFMFFTINTSYNNTNIPVKVITYCKINDFVKK